MSRAFVKEEDQEEAPFISPRAALPPGVTNYVTASGLKDLKLEKAYLEAKKEETYQIEDEKNRRFDINLLKGKLKLLEARISSARLLESSEQPNDVIRFGAQVELKINGAGQKFQLVGADEADIKAGKIAFFSPIAKVISGKKIGDKINFQLAKDQKIIEIVSIHYK